MCFLYSENRYFPAAVKNCFCQAVCVWHGGQTKAALNISISSRRSQISSIRNEHNRARCPLILSSAEEVADVLQGILCSSGRRLRKHSVSHMNLGAGVGDQGMPLSWRSIQRPRQPRHEGSTSPLRGEATINDTPCKPHRHDIPFILSEEVRRKAKDRS